MQMVGERYMNHMPTQQAGRYSVRFIGDVSRDRLLNPHAKCCSLPTSLGKDATRVTDDQGTDRTHPPNHDAKDIAVSGAVSAS